MTEIGSWVGIERSATPSAACDNGYAIFEALGLVADCHAVGTAITTWTCNVTDRKGRRNVGRGKGIGKQALASALFEALEHYIYECEDISKAPRVALNLDGTDVALRGSSPDLRAVACNSIVPLTRLVFSSMTKGQPDVLLPAFLTNPDFSSVDPAEDALLRTYGLLRYSTNSGTASGLTEAEATLHALLESIERDALGIELLRTIIRRSPQPVRRVRIDTLPGALRQLCEMACAEADAIIELWNITSDLEVPTFLAALTERRGKRRYFGSGASLSSAYAVERAVLEAVQGFHVYTHLNSPRPLFGRTEFNESSLYQMCFLEAGHFGYRGGVSDVSFADSGSPIESLPGLGAEEQVEHLISKLRIRGMHAYSRALCSEALFVVQVCIPSLERFHLVSQGIPVAPGQRGRAFLDS